MEIRWSHLGRKNLSLSGIFCNEPKATLKSFRIVDDGVLFVEIDAFSLLLLEKSSSLEYRKETKMSIAEDDIVG